MLQRAASNAYSWWWASHIRTKQSKWLEQNLQDMEEKVQITLKLIEEDGDSFAKRAEMYYKKRPELISFVEESYRAYRALAERYDKISTELQNANNTIASVFPEQVQFAMDEEEEDAKKRSKKKFVPEESGASKMNVPAAPKGPMKDLKPPGIETMPGKILARRKTMRRTVSTKAAVKSGLSKPEAMEEIDRLQKNILTLQTEKEFVKSSYENGVTKYWEIENSIKEKQDRVSILQDEFGEGILIDDGEARSLMAEAALRSCQDKLAKLQHKQESSTEEAMLESQRIREVRERLASLKTEFQSKPEVEEQSQAEKPGEEASPGNRSGVESVCEKIKDQFVTRSESGSAFTVTQMVEKIDELVNKVMSLETAVSSQAALVERLKSETDELQAQVRSLEGDKVVLIDGKNELTDKIKEMEEKMDGILVLDKNFKDQNDNLQMHFTEASCNLGHLSDKLHGVRSDEEKIKTEIPIEIVPTPLDMEIAGFEFKPQLEDVVNPFVDFPTTKNPFVDFDEADQAVDLDVIDSGQKEEATRDAVDLDVIDSGSKEEATRDAVELDVIDSGPKEKTTRETEEPDWQKMFEDGMGGKEKTLLTEYTSTLRSYKEVKKRLGEAEKKNRDGVFETSMALKELKSVNEKKDEEIRSLKLKLGVLEDSLTANDSNAGSFAGFQTALNEPDEEDIDVDIKNLREPAMSATEEKFRADIDELLEENLDFWLRFSTSFHQIQTFDTGVEDLKSEIQRLKEKRDDLDENNKRNAFKSDARPLYKHLREIQTELNLWLENSVTLKEELQCRFSSLCDIQEEITVALKASAENDNDGFFGFTSHQAAKFQGEVLNMKQENNKVADELQAGLDHITAMQIDVDATLVRLDDEFELSGASKKKIGPVGPNEADGGPSHSSPASPQLRPTSSRSRIPLRSFIFGVRSKKQKPSIFACVTPAMIRKYHNGLKTGPPY